MKILTARPHRLLTEMIRRIGRIERQGGRCMLIVPSQYTLQAELEVMTQLQIDGTFMIDVLSPGRLQGRVFERAGAPKQTIFDERGKRMILSRIIEEEKEELTVYRSAAEQGALGLAERMSALIADFKRSEKTAEEIAQAAQQMKEEGRMAWEKLQDAAHIYAVYEKKTKDLLFDAEDVSREFLLKLERSGVLKDQHIFVYGFDMITPQFARQLVKMAALSASLTLAVETDANSAPDGRLFAPVNFSLDRLSELAGQDGIPIEQERIDAELHAHEEIRRMERGLYALGVSSHAGDAERIELYAVSSVHQEVHKAAASIRRMLAAGMESAEIAVVYPKGSEYAPRIAGIFPRYGLHAHLAEKRAAGAHPLCRFISSALAVISGGWRTADVTECIQSGFLPMDEEERDAFCAYIEGMDIRGEAIKKPFVYMKHEDGEKLARLNGIRERVCAPLQAFAENMRRAKTADEAIDAVMALLRETDAFDRLGDMRRELLEAGLNPEAEDCAQVWNRLMETLDQLHELLGGERISAKLMGEMLSSGLSSLELSALPPADGAIVCGEIGNVRTARVHTLFAMGMNDMSAGAEAGIFTQQEQEEAARSTGVYLGMSLAERAALAQLDELKTLTAAREKLVLSYALADETGKALREGSAVQGIRRVFPGLSVRGGLVSEEREDMLCAPDAALEAISVQLSAAVDSGDTLAPAYAEAYAALLASGTGKEKLLAVTRRLGGKTPCMLRGTQARALYGRPVMSVSRLETFAQCPYRHFVTYGLSPQEKVKQGVDRAELGTLYHEAAERFTRAVTQREDFPQVDNETCDRLMDEALAPLIEAWRKSPLGETQRGAAVARRIEKTAKRTGRNIVSQFAGGRFKPMSFEMVFGRRGAAPIMLELPDGMFVYLQGRIDRIDVLDEGTKRIRVIDYKSGMKKFDPTMVYFGIQLQLLLYLAAALEQMPDAQPAGFFYCRITDPLIKSESRIKEEIERQIARKLSLAGISLSDVEVLRAQGSEHAAMITRDGKPSGAHKSAMTDEAGMDAMVDFARRRASQLAAEAYQGVIEAYPAAYGQYNACSYCDYAAICRFDPATGRRKRLEKKSAEDLR